MKTLSKLSTYIGWVLLFFLCFLIASKTLVYMDFKIKNILIGREALIKNGFYFAGFYLHVALGTLALLAGPFQFVKKLRTRFVKQHRLLGKVYVFSCLLAGLASFGIAFFANGGLIARIGFMAAALCWLYLTYRAFIYAKRGEFRLHHHFMLLSFAMTFAAVTLRVWIGILYGAVGLEYETAYQIVAWLSWVPNLLIAQLVFVSKRRLSSEFV